MKPPLGLLRSTLAALAAPALCAQSYSIQDVGTLSTDPTHEVRAHGLNNRGHVHGENDLPAPAGSGKINAFFWDGQQQHKILPLAPALSFGGGINDGDVCVGYSSAGSVQLHGHLWENDVTSDIYVGSLDFSHANDINAEGYVTGTTSAFIPGYFVSQFRPYLRDPAGGWIDLGTLGGGTGFAEALNDHNNVVGIARDVAEKSRGFFWTSATGMIQLPALGGEFSDPRDVDNFDRVVGGSQDASGGYRPFLWDAGVLTDLGTLGGPTGYARGINDHGDIVGVSADSVGVVRATLWTGGAALDLNTLIPPGTGWDLTGTRAINELGEIAGTGTLLGNRRAYRLTPLLSRPRLSGFQPGIAGRENRLFGLGLSPGALIFLIYGFAPGSLPVPGCSGASIDLGSPKFLAVVQADADGRIELPVFIPGSGAGVTVLLQGVDPVACEVSELTIQSFF